MTALGMLEHGLAGFIVGIDHGRLVFLNALFTEQVKKLSLGQLVIFQRLMIV